MASDGVVNHINAVRLRVTGVGNLQSQFMGMDEINVQTLPNLALVATTNREPTIYANFIDQRASLYIFTNQINETFQISRITIFTKPIATQYPQ